MDLCDFACNFPAFVEMLLDREARLSGKRTFREETVTDVLTACLMAFRREGLFVDYPDEKATGADMVWTFVSVSSLRRFRFLVQAKRLRMESAGWSNAQYHHLLHTVTSASGAKQLQLDVLCGQASAAVAPLYAFYNPGAACQAHFGLDGATLADAFAVRAAVRRWRRRKTVPPAIAAAARNPLLVTTLMPLMRPFALVFCPLRRELRVELSADGLMRLLGPYPWFGSLTPEEAATLAADYPRLAAEDGAEDDDDGQAERPAYEAESITEEELAELLQRFGPEAPPRDEPAPTEIVFLSGNLSDVSATTRTAISAALNRPLRPGG